MGSCLRLAEPVKGHFCYASEVCRLFWCIGRSGFNTGAMVVQRAAFLAAIPLAMAVGYGLLLWHRSRLSQAGLATYILDYSLSCMLQYASGILAACMYINNCA